MKPKLFASVDWGQRIPQFVFKVQKVRSGQTEMLVKEGDVAEMNRPTFSQIDGLADQRVDPQQEIVPRLYVWRLPANQPCFRQCELPVSTMSYRAIERDSNRQIYDTRWIIWLIFKKRGSDQMSVSTASPSSQFPDR